MNSNITNSDPTKYIGWIKLAVYAIVAILILNIIRKIYNKITGFSIFKSEKEEKEELKKDIKETLSSTPKGRDFMEGTNPNEDPYFKRILGKKHHLLVVDYKRLINISLLIERADRLLNDGYKDEAKSNIISAISQIESKLQALYLSYIMDKHWKKSLQSILSNFGIYDIVKKKVLSLPDLTKEEKLKLKT